VDYRSYVIDDRNYSYVAYSSSNRLMTDPLSDFRSNVEARGRADYGKDRRYAYPITDVYVISHGWNFSIAEAVANYHGYMELADRLQNRLKVSGPSHEESFQPYYLFVMWPSVIRPISDMAGALLPFGLDESIRALTTTLDMGAFFLPSVWKQSIHAATNALGKRYPNHYLYEDKGETYGVNSKFSVEAQLGRDFPLSAVLYELFRERERRISEGEPSFRIHCVGHSFGAKLVALAAVEALRRWVERDKERELIELAKHDNDIKKKTTKISDEIGARDYLIDNPSDIVTLLAKAAKAWTHSKRISVSPLESLVMIQPAMHPREFRYVIDAPGQATALLAKDSERTLWGYSDIQIFSPETVLKLIPRKAIVYSNHDHANGFIFNMSQAILNNVSAQHVQAVSDNSSGGFRAIPGLSFFTKVVDSGTTLAFSFLYGAGSWLWNSVVYLPADLYHHVTENPTFDDTHLDAVKYPLNFVDFWLPKFGGRANDHQGFFRFPHPALGRTGLTNLAKGRYRKHWLLGPLEGFYREDDIANVNADRFCRLAYPYTPLAEYKDLPEKWEVYNNVIYSFDASKVYDTRTPPSGAHGDVRSREKITCENGRDEDDKDQSAEKREYTANFVYVFTKKLKACYSWPRQSNSKDMNLTDNYDELCFDQ
jgi:hypothetical protein